MNQAAPIEVVPAHAPALFHAAVARAAEALRAGEVVALPTETVYGLAANALDADAVGRIFAVKGRPAHNPIIVHVASLAQAQACARVWPECAARLAAAFWPGPLTLVLPRAACIPDVVVAGGTTVGIRWPRHPLMQAVIRACGFPLAAPSANRSTDLSPTCAEHVCRALAGRIRWVIDGGPAEVGIESTVLDLTVQPPRVLRPGMIDGDSLAAVLGEVAFGEEPGGRGVRRSPGLLPKHYAPRARLVVGSWSDDAALGAWLGSLGAAPTTTHVLAHTALPRQAVGARVGVLPHDPVAFARALYAALHRCDEAGATLIVVEAVPDGAAWQGIADRLRRATT